MKTAMSLRELRSASLHNLLLMRPSMMQGFSISPQVWIVVIMEVLMKKSMSTTNRSLLTAAQLVSTNLTRKGWNRLKAGWGTLALALLQALQMQMMANHVQSCHALPLWSLRQRMMQRKGDHGKRIAAAGAAAAGAGAVAVAAGATATATTKTKRRVLASTVCWKRQRARGEFGAPSEPLPPWRLADQITAAAPQ